GEGSVALIPGAAWTGDFVTNMSGGLKRGSSYLGMATITMQLNTEAARLWKNGSFYLKAANTHGAMPSSELFGDTQVSSNIEAGNHTFIMEFWIRQRFVRRIAWQVSSGWAYHFKPTITNEII
ncbi:MAG: hypothetical protein LC630_03530, partial [Bacteroidales bacterium]|nr:hypothetical protein [Bacteroidales bacterium]